MTVAHWFLLLYAALGFYNLGVIWLAQAVVCPLFARVGEEEYSAYHRLYASRIRLPVIVPGFALMLSAFVLPFVVPDAVPIWMPSAIVACALVSLFAIVALEIPRHNRLEKEGKQESVIRELVNYNWPRTLTTTVAAQLTLLMLAAAFSPS